MNSKKISITIILLCFLSIIVGIFNSAIKISTAQKDTTSTSSKFFEKISSKTNKIALISLNGTISSAETESFMSDNNSASDVLKSLEKALEDKSVKGVILRINSPGGTVAMSQEIYGTILRIRAEKPVVVSMGDVAASGGYYIASAADRIFAESGTLTGSIGVIMSTMNVQDFMTGKLGIKSVVIKSGQFKDTGSMYRQMRPDEQKLLQDVVNNAYEQFVNAISSGRIERTDSYLVNKKSLSKKTLTSYADGRIFTGEQALKLGFVDQIGGLWEAKTAAKQMASQKFKCKEKTLFVVNYGKSSAFSELFLNEAKSFLSDNSLKSYLPTSARFSRQPLFMWE